MKKALFILFIVVSLNTVAFAQDPNFYIFLCFGQSNMEGFPGIEDQDKGPVDERFQMLATVDFPKQNREKGKWYPAVPPLSRPYAGLGPSDYFGRTLVSKLPSDIKIGIVNVSIGGCKIELFQKDAWQAYAATAPDWMKGTIQEYGGNPYQRLVEMARLAQKDGVIKGILLHQGESNTNDKEWPNKVKDVYENLLKDLNLKAEEVSLLAGEVLGADQKGACASMNRIIDDLPKTIPTAHVVSSEGCASRPDHLHFTAAGYRELGKRYAEKMISLLGAVPGNGAAVTIISPDKQIKVEIRTDREKRLTWSAQRKNQTVLLPSPLGLTVDGVNLGESVTLGQPSTSAIHEKYSTWGNHSVAVNHCNQTVIPVKNEKGIEYELDVRAYDDGVAVRMRVPMKGTTGSYSISGETTSWGLPSGSLAWWARYDGSYEASCKSDSLEAIPENMPLAPPLTFKVKEDLYMSLTEADNDSFPDMGLVRSGNLLKVTFPPSLNGWNHEGAIVTPWRVAIIAEGLNNLVNSDLLTNLCPPPSDKYSFSEWVKPGRSLWQWWSIGAPRMEDQKQWIDAAKRLGFEYYLIDDGWRNWAAPDKDQWACLKEVIAYARTQGVECLVWVNSAEMRSADGRRKYLEKVAALGAAGIKIDFIPPCTPEITRWYEGALKDTAELRLLCNFHGAVKPTGRRRSWPHELTREAVRGHEYHMTRYRRVQAADHDETVLFTRFLAGPADYTPTAFDPREMVGYSWSHLLAQAVNMTSPLLHFAGKYQDFLDNPAENLLRHLPATWDETIVLPGSEIGKTVGFARRRGEDWYIGVLNGGEAATLPINLSFLGQGSWQADMFCDNPDDPATFKRETRTVTTGDSFTVSMSKRGGAVVWVTKAR
jgi:alpha-glucosidase